MLMGLYRKNLDGTSTLTAVYVVGKYNNLKGYWDDIEAFSEMSAFAEENDLLMWNPSFWSTEVTKEEASQLIIHSFDKEKTLSNLLSILNNEYISEEKEIAEYEAMHRCDCIYCQEKYGD